MPFALASFQSFSSSVWAILTSLSYPNLFPIQKDQSHISLDPQSYPLSASKDARTFIQILYLNLFPNIKFTNLVKITMDLFKKIAKSIKYKRSYFKQLNLLKEDKNQPKVEESDDSDDLDSQDLQEVRDRKLKKKVVSRFMARLGKRHGTMYKQQIEVKRKKAVRRKLAQDFFDFGAGLSQEQLILIKTFYKDKKTGVQLMQLEILVMMLVMKFKNGEKSHELAITIVEKNFIYDYFQQNDFFKKLLNSKQEVSQEDRVALFFSILEYMKIETFLKAEAIITHGEVGDKFYILLNGLVNVYTKRGELEISTLLKAKEEEEAKERQVDRNMSKFRKKAKKQFHKARKKKIKRQQQQIKDDHKQAYRNPIQFIFNIIGATKRQQVENDEEESRVISDPGLLEIQPNSFLYFRNGVPLFQALKEMKGLDQFGEIALLSKCNRTATIIVKSYTCCLLSLTKSLYAKICDKLKLESLTKFGKSDTLMSKFVYNWKSKPYKLYQHIFKKGDPPKYMYMIKKGLVEVYTEMKELNQTKKFKNDGRPKKVSKKFTLSILGQGEILGEEEIMKGIPRLLNARAITNNAELYYISHQTLKGALDETQEIKKLLLKKSKLKKIWRKQQFEKIQESQHEFEIQQKQKIYNISKQEEFQHKKKQNVLSKVFMRYKDKQARNLLLRTKSRISHNFLKQNYKKTEFLQHTDSQVKIMSNIVGTIKSLLEKDNHQANQNRKSRLTNRVNMFTGKFKSPKNLILKQKEIIKQKMIITDFINHQIKNKEDREYAMGISQVSQQQFQLKHKIVQGNRSKFSNTHFRQT